MNDFHFLRPNLLLLMIPLGALLASLIYAYGSKNNWNKICSKELQPYILVENASRKLMLKILSFLTLSLLILALAGPTWTETPRPLIQSQSGLIIALDLSPTMNAEDIKPSRLKRALYKINDLLNSRKEGQTALVVFSGDPFVVTPLTDDIGTIKALLPALDTTIMPSSGHNVSKTVSKAVDLFNQAGISQGSILLITSELQAKDLEGSIKIARENKIKISVLAVGTNENAPISKPRGGFLTDQNGALVIAKLDTINLGKLAKSTDGVYVPLAIDDNDIHELNTHFVGSSYANSDNKNKNMHNQWQDEGYWLVLLALPLASLLFRRGVILTALFLIPQTLQATFWETLWSTPDQLGEQLFYEGKYEEAREKFQNADWQAATNYNLGDYKVAANLFETNMTAEGLYNLGTTKAKQGDYKGALKAYDTLLKEQPDHEDALYNKKIIEEHLKQQEKEQENQNQNKNQDQKQDQENDKDSAQDKESKKREGSEAQTDQQQNEQQQQEQQQEQKQQKEQQNNPKKEDSEIAMNESHSSDDLEEEQKSENNLEGQDSPQGDESQKEKEVKEKEVDPVEDNALQDEMDEQQEQRQIDNRWLNRIPDDPGSLLRRKFLYQYKSKGQKQ